MRIATVLRRIGFEASGNGKSMFPKTVGFREFKEDVQSLLASHGIVNSIVRPTIAAASSFRTFAAVIAVILLSKRGLNSTMSAATIGAFTA